MTHDLDEALLLADRVLVSSPRPARIVAEVAVGLPRPREAGDVARPEVADLRRRLMDALRADGGGRVSTADRMPAAAAEAAPARAERRVGPGGGGCRCSCCRSPAWRPGRRWCWLASPRDWLLPSPADVAQVLWDDRSRLWFHAQATIAEAAVGFALAASLGFALAVAIVASRGVEAALYPWLIASQAIPILAVAPIVAVWLDYGAAQVMVAFVVAFFPVVVTGVDGLRGVDPALGQAARTLGASRSWAFWRASVPASLPSLFSGLKMAAVFAVTGAVVAEYVGADRGLGYLSEFSTAEFRTDRSFAAIVLLAADRHGVLRRRERGRAPRPPLPAPRRPPVMETPMRRRLRSAAALLAVAAALAALAAGCGGDDSASAPEGGGEGGPHPRLVPERRPRRRLRRDRRGLLRRRGPGREPRRCRATRPRR